MMRSYIITLPRGAKIDIFNLPKNFKEVIEKDFSEYIEGTTKDYLYCGKWAFIDCMMEKINNSEGSREAMDKLVKVIAKVITIVMNYEG